MSFPRYPEYKDSGVEWLGQVPAHWGVPRLRFTAQLNASKNEVRQLPSDTVVSFLPMEAIGEDGSIDLSRERTLADVAEGYTYVRDGDVAFAKITPCFENGKGAVMRGLQNGIGFGTTELIVVRPELQRLSPSFLHYLFTSTLFRQAGESMMYGAGGQKRVPDSFARDAVIPLPSLKEQRVISGFLDREAAKIDALVAEQERLITLLKEKRQAVISHAVTKGLNPGAPMKESGVESLPGVPAHWSLLSLRRFLVFVTSGSRGWADNYADEGALFLRIANLSRGGIFLDLADTQRVRVSEGTEGARTRVSEGDVLFSITAFLGSVAVVPASLEEAYVSQHIALVRIRREELDPKWLGYVALSVVGQSWFEQRSYGGTKIQLSLDDIRDLPVPVPPIEEQLRITKHIEQQLSHFDALEADSKRMIGVLRERRSALITAAVTGQIDVRGLASAEAT